jgi:hypothetical protein
MFFKSITIFSSLFISGMVLAQDSSTKISGSQAQSSSTELKKQAPPAGTDKTDQLITNRNLRSVNGSLSTWSFASTWNYQGGDINKPVGSSRPNLNGASDVPLVQNFSGIVGISYRLTETDRLTLGIGLQMASPFETQADSRFTAGGRNEFEKTQGELDASNPELTYRKIMKPFGVQSILTATSTLYTQDALVDRGFESKNIASLNSLYDFGKSGFSAGMVVQWGFFTHNKDDKAFLQSQTQYEFYALPITEYEINDFMNWRAVYRWYWYQQTRGQSSSEWTTLEPTISTGIGFSITRDIFVYPNIQFDPEDLRSDRTSVGMSANISLF